MDIIKDGNFSFVYILLDPASFFLCVVKNEKTHKYRIVMGER